MGKPSSMNRGASLAAATQSGTPCAGAQPSAMQKGFTLIELMIVVAIVALLAGVALPSYKDYNIRSKWAANIAELEALKLAVKVCMSTDNAYGSCDTVAELQTHGYAGSSFPRPPYSTETVAISTDSLANYRINFTGSADVGSYEYFAVCRIFSSGLFGCVAHDTADTIPEKYVRGNRR